MSTGRKIIFIIALMVFLGSLGMLLKYFITGYLTQKNLEDLKPNTTQENLVTDKGIVIGKYVDLYKKNKDIIGWITVKGTHIDYPVMQTPNDPEFYLRRDFEKKDNVAGVPFIDARSDVFLPSGNFLIYGHNMKNGTMFHDLLEYAEKSFYQKHKIIHFDTIYEGGQGQYEVIAAFYSQIYPESKNTFKYYDYAYIQNEEQFKEYVNGVKQLSVYDTGVSAEFGEQLITLSTCSYHVPDKKGRFAVVAKRIDAQGQ